MDYGIYKQILSAAYAQLDAAELHNDEEHFVKTTAVINTLIEQYNRENAEYACA